MLSLVCHITPYNCRHIFFQNSGKNVQNPFVGSFISVLEANQCNNILDELGSCLTLTGITKVLAGEYTLGDC